MRELVATPDNPVPDGAILHKLRTLDGRNLRAATFPCGSQTPRGTVALFQGHNEFIEKYDVGLQALHHGQGLAAVAGFADDHELGPGRLQPADDQIGRAHV